ncbi:hypothetical protein KAFR_0E03090 [Kazachstania africana CBS 2517]|uniref:Iron transporter FTH1 n=1 Tax=Kazachstania africana (strain ATCC 22294 / BCRC 22015 / CBS 2517 / CECT 1963 / NBRC 1671 / NRRL Y-8276) TaxID=1071382 RepID=H2AVR1_KAZAF|nr:hypothetical protein KAFR_0E03090 [Kazachstania africana CBS 2517]CCF58461.1 hypothetical protein KAFR_0E03090 [Kazachstania africana CBS 2517]
MDFEKLFSFQIFFIFLRESLEIVIIISILLTIVRHTLSIPETAVSSDGSLTAVEEEDGHFTVEEEEELFEFRDILNEGSQPAIVTEDNVPDESAKLYSKLKVQIISGGFLGLLLCTIIGGSFIAVFYKVGSDLWTLSEHYYEGILSIVASVIISFMGLFFLRLGKLREKFRVKLASIIYSDRNKLFKTQDQSTAAFSEKYAFFILPFVTTLREGLEAVVFVGGVGIDQPLSSIPLSMITAVIVSGVLGYLFFKYSSSFSLKICLVITTCFMYLIASGLFSKGVWQLELQDYVNKCHGQDMSEVGSGPGSYDISRSVWHVNCCNGEIDGGWMIFTALFGWTNSATYGSVISYNVYWIILIVAIKLLMVEERNGFIPYLPLKWQERRILKRMNTIKASLQLRHPEQSSDPTSFFQPQRPSEDSSAPLIKDHPDESARHGAV